MTQLSTDTMLMHKNYLRRGLMITLITCFRLTKIETLFMKAPIILKWIMKMLKRIGLS
jgi:hypothetical protein